MLHLSHHRGLKSANRFPSKIAHQLKFLCVKAVSDKVVKHYTGLSIRAKTVRGERLLLHQCWPKLHDQPHSKMPISNQYSIVAPQP